jgi:PAS domain-containing protein
MNGISTPPETQVLEKFKKHKRRQVAQEKQYQRRCQQSLYFKELAFFLPFEKETMSQLDYSTLLQLTIAYLKMKHFTVDQKAIEDTSPRDKVESGDETTDVQCTASPETTACQASSKHLSTGFLSRMLRQTLDGFLMVVSTDGSILFVSDSVRRYLGYFETQLITRQIYDVIIDSDQEEVSKIMRECQMKAMSCKPGEKLDCSFFCRMKCQQKVSRSPCYSMGSGYKLVYVSGHFKVLHEESRLVAMVTPVSTPSIVEIAVEGNMFITHYTLDMRCSFYDGRLQDLLGFSKEEMLKGLVFDHHHHDDILMCQKCAEGGTYVCFN